MDKKKDRQGKDNRTYFTQTARGISCSASQTDGRQATSDRRNEWCQQETGPDMIALASRKSDRHLGKMEGENKEAVKSSKRQVFLLHQRTFRAPGTG